MLIIHSSSPASARTAKPPLRSGDDAGEDLIFNRRVIKKPRFQVRGDIISGKSRESGLRIPSLKLQPADNQQLSRKDGRNGSTGRSEVSANPTDSCPAGGLSLSSGLGACLA